MAWKEMSGTRVVTINGMGPGPHIQDTQIGFIGTAASDAAPTRGQLLTDVLGSGTLPSTDLDAEPSIVQVSDVYKLTEIKNMITVRFRAWYVE